MFSRVAAVVIVSAGLLLLPAEAQQAPKVPRVGFLSPVGESSITFKQFRQGLADLGYVEGQNIIIEPRFADGHYDRLPGLAAELARVKVDIIAVGGAVTVREARKAFTNTPMVFAVVVDPVKDDLVSTLERPSGNITGVTTFDPQQPKKQLELLKQALPGLKRVAILGDRGVSEALMKANEEQARVLGLQSQGINVAGPTPDLEGAFAAFRQEHADAVVVLEEPVPGLYRKQIAELAAKHRLPTMFPPLLADAGGLIAYGTSFADGCRRMATYVDKILKGAKPGDLPVETLTRYELVVNLKTAREIGVTIPPEVLKRADRVIE